MMDISGRKVAILGAGKRTGVASANYIIRHGGDVLIYDDKDKESLDNILSHINGKYIFFNSDAILKEKVDFVVASPGFPPYHRIFKGFADRGIEIIGDIELAYRIRRDIKYIAITGTDGKTTTTTLVGEALKKAGIGSVAGNIGIPVLDILDSLPNGSVLALELSSFQLELIREFKPYISCIINIAEDHLDRYNNIEEYISAKEMIFKNQDEDDYTIINLDSSYYRRFLKSTAKKVFVSYTGKDADVFVRDGGFFYHDDFVADIDKIRLKGVHNLENIACSIGISISAGLGIDVIRDVLYNTDSLPHRNEYAGEVNGIKFYNNSKATTVNAVIKSIMSFASPIILMLGGKDKGLDFSLLNEAIADRVKAVVCYGEAGKRIFSLIEAKNKVIEGSMKDAFFKAYSLASSGDIVLLAPACSSFDEFANYEERGDVFRKLVHSLIDDK